MRRRGMILILSSPSGAGKTTLTRMMLQDKALDLTLSISVTTRARRSSEADGIHYHFITRHQFDVYKNAGDLLESAEVHGSFYGTPRAPVEAVRARLAQSVAALMDSSRGFDENRLHQEAILLAAKADVREELDRLKTHIAAARALLAEGASVGRRLDFLAQELGREASTYCAKANDAALTAIGLELRVEIEQLSEQVQNIE